MSSAARAESAWWAYGPSAQRGRADDPQDPDTASMLKRDAWVHNKRIGQNALGTEHRLRP